MRKERRFLKTTIIFITVLIMFFTAAQTNAAELSEELFITLKINGSPIFTDANPYIKQNRTFVPIRFVAEAFNMDVDWIQEEQKAILKDDSHTIEMWIDSNKLLVNNEERIMDVNVEGFNGRTMVPVRYFAEIMGFSVDWDKFTYSVEMNRENTEIPASNLLNRPYNDDDIIWLARIVDVEGRNLSIDGKVAIANVVLNRTNNSNFPNTIYGVIFDAEYTKQFPPAHRSGFRELEPTSSSVIAAKMALEGVNNIDRCLYFNNRPFSNKSDDLFKVIEGEYFYY